MKQRATAASDKTRLLAAPGLYAAAGGMALAVLLAGLEPLLKALGTAPMLPAGFHAQLVLDALRSDWVTLALPVLCALPYTTSFVDDVKSGFIKSYLHRAGMAAYIRGKLTACALSGGLALFAGVLLAWGIAVLALTPLELAPGAQEATRPYFAELLTKAAVLFCSGAFWSLVGFTAAALTMNRFIAYASPFILYYVLIILHERYFEWLYVLYPKEWIDPSAAWVLGQWGVVLLLAELCAAVSLVFALAAKRRLANV